MKLGKTQEAILRALKQHKGWYRGAGWRWSSTGETERLLETLVKRGLVVAVEETFSPGVGPSYVTKVYRPKEPA